MGKKIIWTNHAIAELNEAFLELLEQSESIETTTRVIDEVVESADILSNRKRYDLYCSYTLRKKRTVRILKPRCTTSPDFESPALQSQ